MKVRTNQPNKADEQYPTPEQIEKLYRAWEQGGKEALGKALEENEKHHSEQGPEEPRTTE